MQANKFSLLGIRFGVVAFLVFLIVLSTSAQTTAFNYQGKLDDSGVPASGSFQMQFKLFDAVSGGGQIGSTITDVPITATDGVFSVKLDFGSSAFAGADRFLEIAVRHNSGESYITLTPRQQIASSPYSIKTLSAAMADDSQKLGGVAANQFVQTNDARLSDPRNPLPGSANYVQNTSSPQTANFNISGNGTVGTLNLNGAATVAGISPPAVAPAAQARFFFNSATNKLRISENGGAYVDLVGASGVGGSGTTNKLPLFSAATTLADSAIAQSGTNVGIGTTSPTAQLNVIGGGFPNNLRVSDSNTTATAFDLSNTSSGGRPWRFQSVGGGVSGRIGNLEIWEASTAINPAIAIQPNGNVGIGTTAPTSRLQVDGGNVLVRGTNNFGSNGDTAAVNLGDSNHYIRSVSGSGVRIGTFGVGDGITLLQSSGNVGIGTTNPATKLDVAGGSGDAIRGISTGGGRGLWGQSDSWQGVYGKSNTNAGVVGDSTNQYGVFGVTGNVSGSGVYGSNNAASGTGVIGQSSSGNGVAGLTTAGNGLFGTTQTGTGVYGQSTGIGVGRAIFAEGNAGQTRNKSGFVKAMAYINFVSNPITMVQCYNGNTNNSSGFCGFGVSDIGSLTVSIDFGFQVSDRFIILTPVDSGGDEHILRRQLYIGSLSGNVVQVHAERDVDGNQFGVPMNFMIVVF